MSEDEQYMIIGKTISELSSAKRRLVCLEHRAIEINRDIQLVLDLLTRKKTGHLKEGVFYIHKIPHGMSVNNQVSWPIAEDVSEIISDIETTEKEIERLQGEKDKLGLKDG